MDPKSLPAYEAQIVPALHRIQHEYGYLPREALERFSQEARIPLYRLNAIASFFPHFCVTPPPAVTVRVCRDMACHMAGAGELLKELKELPAMTGSGVHVEGVSCLGRCDRAPAVCVSIHRRPRHAGAAHPPHHEHEADHGCGTETDSYYLARSPAEVKQLVEQCAAYAAQVTGTAATASGSTEVSPLTLPQPDCDAGLPYPAADWVIDPYRGRAPNYAAVQKAVEAQGEALDRAVQVLRGQFNWRRRRAEQFRLAAEGRLVVEFPLDQELLDAVRFWQTEDGWAKGPTLGGWADALLKEMDDAHADLRGMGGAGIPATQKWRDVRDAVRTARRRRQDDRAFIVVNGDESEPGTFKDRELLLRTPHLVVEGVILAGIITDATQGFIYIRHEYPEQIAACREAIRQAEALGVCGPSAGVLGRPFPVSVFVSPGGYICGEQSALIEAMSDRRAEPRNMPPKLETNGLLDRPTLVSNVETFAWVPYILLNGGSAYAALGVNGWKGRRFFSVSGDVNRPGVYEAPMGLTLRELIYGDQYCRGIVGGRPLKGFAPSGPSGGFLPAKLRAGTGLPRDHVANKSWLELAKRRGFDPQASDLDLLDLELELNLFRALSPTQALGAGLVVYAEGRDMVDHAVNAVEFFRNESCGKCVPCRIGSQKLAALGCNLLEGRLDPGTWEGLQPTLGGVGRAMELASICGLGRSVPVPLRTAIVYFNDDVARHLNREAADDLEWPPKKPAAETTAEAAAAEQAGGEEDQP